MKNAIMAASIILMAAASAQADIAHYNINFDTTTTIEMLNATGLNVSPYSHSGGQVAGFTIPATTNSTGASGMAYIWTAPVGEVISRVDLGYVNYANVGAGFFPVIFAVTTGGPVVLWTNMNTYNQAATDWTSNQHAYFDSLTTPVTQVGFGFTSDGSTIVPGTYVEFQYVSIFDVEAPAVPEPAALGLLGSASAAAMLRRRNKR